MAIAALIEHAFQPRGAPAALQQRDCAYGEMFAAVVDSGMHAHQCGLIRYAAYLHAIGLGHMSRRISKGRRPHAVVAQQQQAFAGFVEATDRRQPGQIGVGKQGVDGAAALFIPYRCEQAARLVQRQINTLTGQRGVSVQINARMRGTGLLGIARKAAIDLYPSRTHDHFGLSARAQAAPRNLARESVAGYRCGTHGDVLCGFGKAPFAANMVTVRHAAQPSTGLVLIRRRRSSHRAHTCRPEHSLYHSPDDAAIQLCWVALHQWFDTAPTRPFAKRIRAPEMKKPDLRRAFSWCGLARNYCPICPGFSTLNSMRRFCARPSALALLATGSSLP